MYAESMFCLPSNNCFFCAIHTQPISPFWNVNTLHETLFVLCLVTCSGEGSNQGLESSTTSQGSGVDTASLDAAMQEIAESIQELGVGEGSGTEELIPNEAAEDEEEDDSDSEDEGGTRLSLGYLTW